MERKQLITVYMIIFPRGNQIWILFYSFDHIKAFVIGRVYLERTWAPEHPSWLTSLLAEIKEMWIEMIYLWCRKALGF